VDLKVLIVAPNNSSPTISEIREYLTSMNADDQIVCIVEDDQGEGYVRPLELEDLERKLSRAEKKLIHKENRARSEKHSRRPR
jgi:hypothetical protein